MTSRHTIVTHGLLAKRDLRLEVARACLHGRQLMTFEALACRLAGGFSAAIDDETLRDAIQHALPETELGELEKIKLLPGMVDAAAGTLRKVWRSEIDLQGRADEHPRISSVAKLEEAVLTRLPASMMRPIDLVSAGMERLEHAKALFGDIDIVGITELSPCWRPLLHALAQNTSIRWIAGPRPVPAWLDVTLVKVDRSDRKSPSVNVISASTTYHEVIEAVRWARQLLASGTAKPAEIAIAATIPADYDDDFLAVRSDANLDVHFVHGVKVTATRDGQTTAALADIVVRGISQTRFRRLALLIGDAGGPFKSLPRGWMKILPSDAPLATSEAWRRLLNSLKATDWPDGENHVEDLRKIVGLLEKGTVAAAETGETLLNGQALKIWRKALLAGPAASLDATINALKQGDGLEGSVCVAWMPASELAASPRRFVRLLGLNSSRWPRGISEDRLLSDHVIRTSELDPLPVGAADRRDFETILATTESEIVISRSRRDSDGRLLGRSPLLQGQPAETYLRRNAVPVHAMSETDRLLARPAEFMVSPQAASALECWRDWHRPELTPHDGLVRPDHPVLLAILNRTQSASSLSALLRNPIGFVWKYGLDLKAPESDEEPLVLNNLDLGNLIHGILDRALRAIEAAGNLTTASLDEIASAIEIAAEEVADEWEADRSVPPRIVWRKTLEDARTMAERALTYREDSLPNARSYCEVPFGGSERKSVGALPWDSQTSVKVPGTDFRIAGYIDRLDLAEDGRRALVRDYKTGKTPKDKIVLNGGKELQRCLYAFAVKALMGDGIEVSASLFFPRDLTDLRLENPDVTLVQIGEYLQFARTNLSAGNSVIGIETGGDYDDLAFALPANRKATYLGRKLVAATERLGDAALIWEAE
jgi:hypothetical protein